MNKLKGLFECQRAGIEVRAQQRILQAAGARAGAVPAQPLAALRTVPREVLVLSSAQHPLHLQDKQDHDDPALVS